MTPFLCVLFACRLIKGKEDKKRFFERLGYPKCPRPDGKLIWMHGASVGECLSMLPLINRLLELDPSLHIMVTSGTVTSATLMAKRLPERAFHQFMPIDSPWGTHAFVRYFHPDAVFWFESEFWPNALYAIHKAKIPLILLNGRISDRSFVRWQKAPGIIKSILGLFTLTLGQSPENARRLQVLGSANVDCIGNLKYAASIAPFDAQELTKLKDQIGSRPAWTGASTHHNEEEQMAQVHLSLKQKYPTLLTVCVPRHPNRATEIENMCIKQGLKIARRSRGDTISSNTDFYLADTIGEMGLLYQLTDIVFVGGSLIPFGGQNMLEPMRLKRATIVGPHAFNFREIVTSAKENNALIEVENKEALAQTIDTLLSDPNKITELGANAEQVATSEMNVLDRLYSLMQQRGIL
ncbi:MAG: 3-deoxy-D-manno-octulosonic acid transferase [Alphaproteobacteria bacterium]|nr:3-deoxy-D-manno-octulosonic acid transferase [Alphaproteobacteria bacterium]